MNVDTAAAEMKENAVAMVDRAKRLAGELKEAKRAAEKRFFVPVELETKMRHDAHALEVAHKALLFMASEFAQRAPNEAIEAMDHFIDFMRISETPSTKEAEEECAKQLEFALWFYNPDRVRAERKSA